MDQGGTGETENAGERENDANENVGREVAQSNEGGNTDSKKKKTKTRRKKQREEEENGEDAKDDQDKDSCFKCLRCWVITLTVILLILSFGLLVLGVILNTSEDLLLGGFKDTMESSFPQNATDSVPKDDEKLAEVSSLMLVVGSILIGLGVFFLILCIFIFAIACCCWRRRKCLICCLLLIILLGIGQIVLLVIIVEGSLLEGAINNRLTLVMVTEHEKNQILTFGLQTKFLCCGVFGSKDYFCKGLYDFRCNKGCRVQNVTGSKAQNVTGRNDLCRVPDRAPLDATSLPVCSSASELESVASSDFRFAEIGNKTFNETTAREPGCGQALWKHMHLLIIGMIGLASFILFLEMLVAFFACYSVAKNKARAQEKMKSDAKNRVKDISVQTSFTEDKASQTHDRPGETDSGIADLGSPRALPLIQSPMSSISSTPPLRSANASRGAPYLTPPGYIDGLNRSYFPDREPVGSGTSIEIVTENGTWYQKHDGLWSLRRQ